MSGCLSVFNLTFNLLSLQSTVLLLGMHISCIKHIDVITVDHVTPDPVTPGKGYISQTHSPPPHFPRGRFSTSIAKLIQNVKHTHIFYGMVS